MRARTSPLFISTVPYRLSCPTHTNLYHTRPQCTVISPSLVPSIPTLPLLNPRISYLRFDKVPTNYDWTDDENNGNGKGKGGGDDNGGNDEDDDGAKGWENFVKGVIFWISRHPIRTKMMTSGILAGLGDSIAQKLSDNNETKMNWKRAIGAGIYVGILGGPAFHGWYAFLGRLAAGLGRKGIALKLLLDQFLFAWVVNGGFIFGTGCIESGRLLAGFRGLKKSLWPVMTNSWKFWPPVQLINFMFVPIGLQVLWSNVAGFVWVIIMSTLSHASKDSAVRARAT